MFVTSLILLFLLRIRFPNNIPITSRIVSRYNTNALSCFRRYESTLKKLNKARLDLIFLNTCKYFDSIPKFLRIRVLRRPTANSSETRSFYKSLLVSEIFNKENVCASLSHDLLTTYISNCPPECCFLTRLQLSPSLAKQKTTCYG